MKLFRDVRKAELRFHSEYLWEPLVKIEKFFLDVLVWSVPVPVWMNGFLCGVVLVSVSHFRVES